ncbi:MAG: hypothetical protein VB031_02135 [Eubacteriaceae bacterium]|nr:hypothetical protein [Eubacteriaceae bacterium]
MATPQSTFYKVVAKNSKYKIDLTDIATEISWGDEDGELAAKATITIDNVVWKGRRISNQLPLTTWIFVYTSTDKSSWKERFRGLIWEYEVKDESEEEYTMLCYDRLIYLTRCKDNIYIPKNKTTKYILSKICKKWHIKMSYKWYTHKHSKKKFYGEYLSDMITETMESARRKLRVGYVISMDKSVMYVRKKGTNNYTYSFASESNTVSVSRKKSMDELVTKVLITGTAKKNGHVPVKATVKGSYKKYGTLQEIVEKDKKTKMRTAKREAKNILQDQGRPAEEIVVETIDVPGIRKGHAVKVKSGALNGTYFVTAVTHDGKTASMTMELEVIRKNEQYRR